MLKRNIFLLAIIMVAMLSACSNGNQAETKDAEKVEVIKNSTTAEFKTVESGSAMEWRAAHLGGVQPRFGKVYFIDGSVLVNKGKLTNATFTVDMKSLTVENFPEGAKEIEQLTGHLLSKDFFDIEKYPRSKFELTKVETTTKDYNSKVTGNLTILGVTKSISFDARINIADDKVSISSEDFSINRTDWGLTYNVEGTAGVPVDYLIANDIGFTINATVTR